jgi:hypothetical protein
MGTGFVTPLGTGLYRVVISANLNIYLFTPLYLEIGTDIYREPSYALKTIYAFYINPTLKINLVRKKVSLYTGIGFYYYYETIMGLVFSIKSEYNINDYLSLGMGIKHPNFFGAEFSNEPLFIGLLHFTFKL